jgi:hypothetical protein
VRTLSFRLSLCLALALPLAPIAHAQTEPGRPAPTAPVPASELKLNMESEHTLKEVLLKDRKIKHEPGQAEPKAGDIVPESVALHDFPEEIAAKVPQIKSHRFYIAGDMIVVVRPQERKVVGVVK